MSRRIFENAALIFFIGFVAIGLIYSIYTSVFSTSADKINMVIANQIDDCNRAFTRSIVNQNFMREAASARRAQASEAHSRGDTVEAQNNIATAEQYEKFAQQYDNATVKNCEKTYGG